MQRINSIPSALDLHRELINQKSYWLICKLDPETLEQKLLDIKDFISQEKEPKKLPNHYFEYFYNIHTENLKVLEVLNKIKYAVFEEIGFIPLPGMEFEYLDYVFKANEHFYDKEKDKKDILCKTLPMPYRASTAYTFIIACLKNEIDQLENKFTPCSDHWLFTNKLFFNQDTAFYRNCDDTGHPRTPDGFMNEIILDYFPYDAYQLRRMAHTCRGTDSRDSCDSSTSLSAYHHSFYSWGNSLSLIFFSLTKNDFRTPYGFTCQLSDNKLQKKSEIPDNIREMFNEIQYSYLCELKKLSNNFNLIEQIPTLKLGLFAIPKTQKEISIPKPDLLVNMMDDLEQFVNHLIPLPLPKYCAPKIIDLIPPKEADDYVPHKPDKMKVVCFPSDDKSINICLMRFSWMTVTNNIIPTSRFNYAPNENIWHFSRDFSLKIYDYFARQISDRKLHPEIKRVVEVDKQNNRFYSIHISAQALQCLLSIYEKKLSETEQQRVELR